MAKWAHGYNVEVPYTFGFYKETSPLWIKYATLLAGKRFPSLKSLRVLELGCGQGYNLLLLASAFPKYEFLGIDINPSHIAHARDLANEAGLENVDFYEADFVELSENYPKEYGSFHIVILHGIWSWIGKEVRSKVVEILKKALVPGAVVYNSYDAMPGWMHGNILREILWNYYKVSGLPAIEAIERGLELAKKLIETNALVFQFYPALKGKIEQAIKQNRNYLVHEYLHQYHGIYWIHEVVEEMLEAKLYYIGSANLVDHYLTSLMPEPMRYLVTSITHPIFRLFISDLLINQSFRRDLYQKGHISLSSQELQIELGNFKVTRVEDYTPKTDEEFRFKTPLGEVTGKREIYQTILQAIPVGTAKTIRDISEDRSVKALQINFSSIIQAITFLLDAGLILPYNETGQPPHAMKLNRIILKKTSEGQMYNFLSSPRTGLAVYISNLEALILNSILDGVRETTKLNQVVYENLKRLGQRIVREGKVIENEDETRQIIENNVAEFLTKRMPILKAHGIVN